MMRPAAEIAGDIARRVPELARDGRSNVAELLTTELARWEQQIRQDEISRCAKQWDLGSGGLGLASGSLKTLDPRP